MTTLLRSRQRAEAFAALVDGTRTPLRDVSSASVADRELARLAGVAQTLRHASEDDRAVPRADYTTDLRERLMTEAATVLTPQQAALALPVRTRSRRERRLVAAASVAVLLGGTAGMAAAAQDALPGEALYPLKRGIESAEVRLSSSPAGQGQDLLSQASGRLDETWGLVEAGPATGAPQVPGTLEDFTAAARRGADLMLTSYAETGDRGTIVALRGFAARDLGTLERLSGVVPSSAQPALQGAMTALSGIDARASEACPSCSDLPSLRIPAAYRASLEAERAIRAIERSHLSNDHPFVADRDAVRRVKQDTSRRDGSAPRARQTSPPSAAPSTPLSRAPDSGASPRLPGGTPKVTTKIDVKVPSGKDTSGAGGDLGAGLGAGLGDAVETLLPDAGSTPKLP